MSVLMMKERILSTNVKLFKTFDELVFEEESGSLLYELCFVEKESHGPIAPGQFKIDTEEEDIEDEETKPKPRTRKLINLRKSIKWHFETKKLL